MGTEFASTTITTTTKPNAFPTFKMPHSTFLTLTATPESKQPSQAIPIHTSSLYSHSAASPNSPFASPSRFTLSVSDRNRAFVAKHMRSKSSSAAVPSSSSVPSLSAMTPFPSSTPRQYAPPLLRSSSLPLVTTMEGRLPGSGLVVEKFPQRYILKTIPAAHSSPVHPNNRPPMHPRSRSSSPTRQWASSQSPILGSQRNSPYYPGSSFHSPAVPAPPPPPTYLVNEPFIFSTFSSTSSSSPSTPTSCRSRSPSISSLETIPDSPDAEAEALEAEMKAALARAAAKANSPSPSDVDEDTSFRRRSTSDGFRDFGLGTRRSSADKRKRWSVCGAEKRADLNLETIWEEAFGAVGNPSADSLGLGCTESERSESEVSDSEATDSEVTDSEASENEMIDEEILEEDISEDESMRDEQDYNLLLEEEEEEED